jgi:hypothetical protein
MAVTDSGRLNQISGEIVDGAIHVHRELGPGLLESTYETCFLLNFDVPLMRDGIKRIVNGF